MRRHIPALVALFSLAILLAFSFGPLRSQESMSTASQVESNEGTALFASSPMTTTTPTASSTVSVTLTSTVTATTVPATETATTTATATTSTATTTATTTATATTSTATTTATATATTPTVTASPTSNRVNLPLIAKNPLPSATPTATLTNTPTNTAVPPTATQTPTPSRTPTRTVTPSPTVIAGTGFFKRDGDVAYSEFLGTMMYGFVRFASGAPAYGGPDGFHVITCLTGIQCFRSGDLDHTGYYAIPINGAPSAPIRASGFAFVTQGRNDRVVSQEYRFDTNEGTCWRIDFIECRRGETGSRCIAPTPSAGNPNATYRVELVPEAPGPQGCPP